MINQTAKGIYILIVYNLWMMIFHFISIVADIERCQHHLLVIATVLFRLYWLIPAKWALSVRTFLFAISVIFLSSVQSHLNIIYEYVNYITVGMDLMYNYSRKFNNINQKIYVIGSTSSPSDSSSRRLEELLKRLMFPIKLSGVDVSVVPDMLCIGSVAG